jgi:cellulose synthase/poly-beta-1,6-N-acetylglucosamine synthase-like glycosyltransferase
LTPTIFTDTLDYLFSLDSEGLVRVFWYFFLFDFPRYIVTDLFILSSEMRTRFRSSRNTDFQLQLRESPPLVSVIIPALNEEATLSWTIRSLQEQTYRNLELIIVDDGSTDRTPEIGRQLARLRHVQFYRFSRRAGKSAVLNYGLKFARGEYIVFVDSDTTFDRDAIYNLVERFCDPTIGGVAGNLRVRNAKRNVLTNLQQIEYMFTISIGRRVRTRLGILPVISGAFGAFRRELISLETNGGHEPGPGNDSDLAIRVRKMGYKIVFESDAVCFTNVPDNVYQLVKQRSRWDRNLIKNRLRKHKDVFNPFTENFRLIDLITFADSLFFHFVLSFVTAFYLLDLAINYARFLPHLLFINFCLYFCAEVLELIIAVILSNRREDFGLMLYMPIFNPYKLFIKLVRVKSYCQEIFLRTSYRDPFAPYKVREQMIKW